MKLNPKRKTNLIYETGLRVHTSVIIERSDLTQEALDLGIWDGLTEGFPSGTKQVEILIVRNLQ